jgi:YfiH family protein
MTRLHEPLLDARGAAHGFAVARRELPPGTARAHQVHGAGVVRAERCGGSGGPPRADALVSLTRGVGACVVTADCVPVLLASADAGAVAAVHAGWRGLALGVVEAGVAALCEAAGVDAAGLAAGIGPHARPCCYEVDAPVLDALAGRDARALEAAARPVRPGHALLDLGALARAALLRAGLLPAQVGMAALACTCCDPRRFASYRRDGPRAGRLVHYIAPGA